MTLLVVNKVFGKLFFTVTTLLWSPSVFRTFCPCWGWVRPKVKQATCTCRPFPACGSFVWGSGGDYAFIKIQASTLQSKVAWHFSYHNSFRITKPFYMLWEGVSGSAMRYDDRKCRLMSCSIGYFVVTNHSLWGTLCILPHGTDAGRIFAQRQQTNMEESESDTELGNSEQEKNADQPK